MDVTARVPVGRQIINSYGDGGFRIAGTAYAGPVLVFPERTLAWSVVTISAISLESLLPVFEASPRVELLLVGCGRSIAYIPKPLREGLREKGVSVDAMGTGAACRTYNVLLAESRRIAAALLPID
jgi:uncharacterized protein